ncbi:MAG: serine/threonine-protein kinase [Gaiellaceae bacterium]
MWKLGTSEGREVQVGDTLGGYRLESHLGEGGMGLVFRAVRETDGHVVALKVLKLDLSEDEIFKQRFKQEARAASEVHDRNLVPILEAGEAEGRDFLAVGYIEGDTLEERLRANGPLGVEETVRVAGGLASGLDALHGAGIVHRDIKASNIIIDQEGAAMLTDFGLAKGRAYTVLTRPGQVMGTLDYLAPELIKGRPAEPATDIYALGCTVYECVAGKTPFADKSLFQVGLAHLEEAPPDPGAARSDLPQGFTEAVLAALAKEPGQRPASAGAYAELLRTAAEGRPG